jgi:hypothetical protein
MLISLWAVGFSLCPLIRLSAFQFGDIDVPTDSGTEVLSQRPSNQFKYRQWIIFPALKSGGFNGKRGGYGRITLGSKPVNEPQDLVSKGVAEWVSGTFNFHSCNFELIEGPATRYYGNRYGSILNTSDDRGKTHCEVKQDALFKNVGPTLSQINEGTRGRRSIGFNCHLSAGPAWVKHIPQSSDASSHARGDVKSLGAKCGDLTFIIAINKSSRSAVGSDYDFVLGETNEYDGTTAMLGKCEVHVQQEQENSCSSLFVGVAGSDTAVFQLHGGTVAASNVRVFLSQDRQRWFEVTH